MSKQNVLDFDRRIRGDKDLQSRVKALPAKDAEGLVKLGAESGFNFSVSELLAVIGPSHSAEELSDADRVAQRPHHLHHLGEARPAERPEQRLRPVRGKDAADHDPRHQQGQLYGRAVLDSTCLCFHYCSLCSGPSVAHQRGAADAVCNVRPRRVLGKSAPAVVRRPVMTGPDAPRHRESS